MFLKSDRTQRRQNHTKKSSFLDSYSNPEFFKRKSPLKHQYHYQTNQKESRQKFKETFSSININSPSKETRDRLLSFQNNHVKAVTRKLIILDQRKLLIKEKIKIKVKEQLEEVLKRMDCASNEQNNCDKSNDQQLRKSLLDVKIHGSSVKKSLRNSVSCRPQIVKTQKIRILEKRQRPNDRMYESNKKMMITDYSPKNKPSRIQSTISNLIRLRDVTPRNFTRKIHSALDDFSSPQKKHSFQIQPWKLTQDF